MKIDWFTISAQLLNFIILVWLMKRFLYKPILNAINKREKRIAAEISGADQKKDKAQKELDEFKQKNEEFDQQRTKLISQATDEVQAERRRLLDEGLNADAALNRKRQETLAREEQELHQTIIQRTQQEVFAIARKVLTDLASMSLEERLCEVFTHRLRKIDDTAKKDFAEFFTKAADPALVQSAFNLTDEQRSAIQDALNATFSTQIPISFVTEPDLISGIELTANGQKVAWSITSYLSSMENSVAELVKQKDKPEPEMIGQ